jgi:hypothetical protein
MGGSVAKVTQGRRDAEWLGDVDRGDRDSGFTTHFDGRLLAGERRGGTRGLWFVVG